MEINEQIIMERATKLLRDLEYEFVRGLHQGHITDSFHGKVFLHDKNGKLWKFQFDLIEEKYPQFNCYGLNKLELVKG